MATSLCDRLSVRHSGSTRRSPSPGVRRAGHAARRLVLVGVCTIVLVLAVAGAANAYTIVGGDKWHRQMVKEILDYNPELLNVVQEVWPNFTVNICYGGRASKGSIAVNLRKTGKLFLDQVVHEFSHEIQLAADAAGGRPAIDGAWRQELIDRGYPERGWVWKVNKPYWGTRNPTECFAENMSMLWPAKYHYAPDTKLAKLTAAEALAFLTDTGVLPL
jgi:hypothetical protein